jgi:hypothetical protein
MITHYKRARAIYNLVGQTEAAKHMDTLISASIASKQATKSGDASSISVALQVMKNVYKKQLDTNGMSSENTIRAGLMYAKCLGDVNCCIEAEQILTKLATVSCRVYGSHHKMTIEADELLNKCKKRFVVVLPDNKPFLALRYDNDGTVCVVQGPITKPSNVGEGRTFCVESNLIVPAVGCPVICHGLISASHLNGELGEVRSFKDTNAGIRLGVHFDKKGAKPALVKPENLRIAFELPSES